MVPRDDARVRLTDNELDLDLFPETKAEYVTNAQGENLKDVEAGAQVNKIEKVKYGNEELTITSKTVTIPKVESAEYSIKKLTSEDSGYSADYASQYVLTKDSVAVGDVINIAKDMVLQNAELKQATAADKPVSGLAKDDYYIEFTFQNKSEPLYLPIKQLMDIYTAGNGLTLSNNQFSIDTTVVATKTDLTGKQNTIDATHKLDADLVDDSTSLNKFVTANEKSTWNGKQDAISDLAVIRSGAAKGATSVQPNDNVSSLTNDANYVTATELTNKKYISYRVIS